MTNICPKCNAPSLQEAGKLFPWHYCTTCHTSFSTHELAEKWGWDVADFYDVPTLETLDPSTNEPVWYSAAQRNREYQVVDEMYMGVGPVENEQVDYGFPIDWGR